MRVFGFGELSSRKYLTSRSYSTRIIIVKPQESILALVCCWIFSIGFVASSSGWGWMIVQMVDDRPDWSVCGLDMCSCLPTGPIEPDCPLCETDYAEPCAEDGLTERPAQRAPFMKNMESVEFASSSMLVSAFVLISTCSKDTELVAWNEGQWSVDRMCRVTRGPVIGVPTPPPRNC
jgi:hypothetical protein